MKRLESIGCIIGAIFILAGCENLTQEQRWNKQFQEKLIKANSTGGFNEINSVRKSYCLGDRIYIRDNSKPGYKTLIKSDQNCAIWTKKLLDFDRAGGKPDNHSDYRLKNKKDFYYIMLHDLVHGDMKSHNSNKKELLISEVASINTIESKEALFDFYTNHARHDEDEKKRALLSMQLCSETKHKKHCNFHAWSLYKQNKFSEALDLYEKHGPYNNYNKLNLAQLYMHPPKGMQPKPTEAIKLTNDAYNGPQGILSSCIKNKAGSSKECMDLQIKRDNELQQAHIEQAFQMDENLQRHIREDKYKRAVTQHLKSKEYQQALIYFDYLDRIEYQLPKGMLFYKAEAYFHTNKKESAKKAYLEYINSEGENSPYYKQALIRLGEINNAD